MVKRTFLVTAWAGILVFTAALTACGEAAPSSPIAALPTPSATLLPRYVHTAQAAEAAARATLAAGRAAQMQAGLTATAAALSMTQAAATQAYFVTATAQSMQATATAQALATRRAQAQATATAQAVALQGTATAQALQATATMQAMALAGTATAQAQQAVYRATQAAVMAQATAQAAAAEREILALQQQRLLNQAWAVARFLLLVGGALLVMGLAAWTVVQWQRYRVVRVAAGKVLVRLGNGWYDPDRNPYPIAVLGPDGRPALPKFPPDDMQERTTARAQYVDLARVSEGKRLPRRTVPIAAPSSPGTRRPLRFRVLTPQEAGKALPGVVTPETAQVLEAEWREAHEEGGR